LEISTKNVAVNHEGMADMGNNSYL